MKKHAFYESSHDTEKNITAEYNIHKNNHIMPHFHRCVEIIYVTKGIVNCVIDGESFTASEGDIIFTKRCGIHELTYTSSTRTILLVITPKYSNDFDLIFQSKTIPAHLSDKNFNKTLLKYFIVLAKHIEKSDIVIKGFVNIIIGKLFEHYPNKIIENSANMNLIISVLNYIDKHYREPITLDTISSEFGYNKYYFSRLFNDSIGENLNNYLNGVRLRNLMQHVRKTEKPILSEIILDYGFESFSTFYRICMQKYNLSPKELLITKDLD